MLDIHECRINDAQLLKLNAVSLSLTAEEHRNTTHSGIDAFLKKCIRNLDKNDYDITLKGFLNGEETFEIFDKLDFVVTELLQDSRGSSKGIRFSGIAAAGRKVIVSVDSLEGKRLPSALADRSRSGSVPVLMDETKTWLREEFEKAEIIPIDSAKRRVRFDSTCDKKSLNESALMIEIEELKVKIKEQDTTFEGYRLQMSDLEKKLQELQAKHAFLRKSEPPPAYDKRNVSYNKLFAERGNSTSTACCIL